MIHPLAAHLGGIRLTAFVDAEMDPDEAHRWRLHLIECAPCSAAVSAERELRNRMRHSCVPMPPTSLLMSLRVVPSPEGTTAAGVGAVPPAGASTRSRAVSLARRLPVGAVAVTTTAAAAAAVAVAVTGVFPGDATSAPRPAAAVTGPLVPAALAPAPPTVVPAVLVPRAQASPSTTWPASGGAVTTSTGAPVSPSPSATATIPGLPGAGSR